MVTQGNQNFVKLLKIYLIFGGLWKYASTCSTKAKIYKIYSIFVKISFILFCVLFWIEYFRLIIQKYDNELIRSQLFLMVNMVKLPIRIWIIMKNKILGFLKIIMEKEELVWNQEDREIKVFYARKVKECNNLMALLIFISVIVGSMLQVVALYGSSRLVEFKRTHNETIETHYGFQIWLPIDKLDHIYIFGIIHLWFGWIGHVSYCTTVLIPPLLFTFVGVELKILEIRIRKFIPSESASFRMDGKIRELKYLIREHQYVIRFHQTLNNAMKNLMLLEFLTNLIDIGSCLINAMKIDTLRWMFLVVATMMLLLMNIFLLSWTSNEIKIQSERIAHAAFECKWYSLNEEGKYLIYFMIARAQKPLTVTIGNFGPMTTATVITVLRAAYSYISVIKGQ